MREHLERDATSLDPLTPREIEVVKLVAEGHTSDEIAGMLFISRKTVDRHRANILEKLGDARPRRPHALRHPPRSDLAVTFPVGERGEGGSGFAPIVREAREQPGSLVMHAPAVTVLVVDDHPALRAGLEQLLDQEPRYRLLGAVSTRPSS